MSRSEKLEQQLARLKDDRPGWVMAVRTAIRARDLDGGNQNDVDAAKANLAAHDEKISDIENWSLPDALEQDQKDAARLATEEQKQQQEKTRKANVATIRGGKVDCDTTGRELKALPDLCDGLARVIANVRKAAADFNGKIPDVRLPYAEHQYISQDWLTDVIRGEMARAGERHGVKLPGAEQIEVPEEPLDKITKPKLDGCLAFLKSVVLDGARDPGYRCREILRQRYEPAGLRIQHGERGAAPRWRLDPLTNKPRPPTRAEADLDIKYGEIVDEYWAPATGEPGVEQSGVYREYIDDTGRVVARFLNGDPAEREWERQGKPVLIHTEPVDNALSSEPVEDVSSFPSSVEPTLRVTDLSPSAQGQIQDAMAGGAPAAEVCALFDKLAAEHAVTATPQSGEEN